MTEEEKMIMTTEKAKDQWIKNSKVTWEQIANEYKTSQATLKACLLSCVVMESVEEQLKFMKESGFD